MNTRQHIVRTAIVAAACGVAFGIAMKFVSHIPVAEAVALGVGFAVLWGLAFGFIMYPVLSLIELVFKPRNGSNGPAS